MQKLMIALLFLLFPSVASAEPNFPALTGRVVDTANVIPDDQEKILSQELRDFQKKTKHEFVVVTIPTLGDYAISDYGYQLGRHWGIGRKDINDGILLIQSTGERKFRIEVGRGMEYILTDAKTSEIIRHVIIPVMKSDKPTEVKNAKAIIDGARAIMKLGSITKEQVEEWEQKEKAAAAKAAAESSDRLWAVLNFLGICLILFLTVFGIWWVLTRDARKQKKELLRKKQKEDRERAELYNKRQREQQEARDRIIREARDQRIREEAITRSRFLANMSPQDRALFLAKEQAEKDALAERNRQFLAQQRREQEERERQETARRRQQDSSTDIGFVGFGGGGWTSGGSSSSSGSDSDSYSGGGGDFGGGGSDGDY